MTATAPARPPRPPEPPRPTDRPAVARATLPRLAGRRRIPDLELVVVALLPVAAVAGAQPLYRTWSFIGRPAIAAVGAGFLGLALHRRRAGLGLTTAAYVVAGLVLTAYVSLNGTMPNGLPTSRTVDELFSALRHGWTATLDAVLPVLAHSPTTTLMVAATWLTSVIGMEVAARSRSVLGPALPSIVLFGLTMPLTSATDASTIVQAAVLAGAVLLFVIVRSSPELVFERSPVTQSTDAAPPGAVVSSRVRTGLPAVVLCAVLGPAIVAAAADPDRFDAFDPRDVRTEQVNLSQAVNPLYEIRGFLAVDPPTDVATVENLDATDAGLVDRVAIVALDTYDGASWTSTAPFEQASSDLAPEGITVDTAEVEMAVTLTDLDTPWLLTPRNPIEISSDAILFSPDDGIMVRDLDWDDTSYTVTGLIARPTTEQLEQATTPASGDMARYTQLPAGVASQFRPLAADLMGDGTAVSRLRALESAMLQYPNVSAAASGHSVGRLLEFLTDDRVGLAEQHAAAFAVLARSQGIPTRLVVGLRTTRADDAGVYSPVTDLTTEDYHVWPEVFFDGVGWVAFEPTPADVGETEAPSTVAVPPVGPVEIQQQPVPEVERPQQGDTTLEQPEQQGRPLRTAVVLSAIAVSLFLLYALLVLGGKALRRHRRRTRGTPSQQLLGAWRDSTDGLLESGVHLPMSMTVDDIVNAADPVVPDPPASAIHRLAPDVRRALYATGEPGPSHIERAWAHAAQFRAELAAHRSRRGRLTAALDPRPLLRR